MYCKVDSKKAETILKLINRLIPEDDKDFDFTDEETNVITFLSLTLD